MDKNSRLKEVLGKIEPSLERNRDIEVILKDSLKAFNPHQPSLNEESFSTKVHEDHTKIIHETENVVIIMSCGHALRPGSTPIFCSSCNRTWCPMCGHYYLHTTRCCSRISCPECSSYSHIRKAWYCRRGTHRWHWLWR